MHVLVSGSLGVDHRYMGNTYSECNKRILYQKHPGTIICLYCCPAFFGGGFQNSCNLHRWFHGVRGVAKRP